MELQPWVNLRGAAVTVAPAFANPQSVYVFPFDLLYLVLPIERATNLVCLLNVILAGVSMYLFGRR